jgi:hypothetical protein
MLVVAIALFVAGYCSRWLHTVSWASLRSTRPPAPPVLDITPAIARSRKRSRRSTLR